MNTLEKDINELVSNKKYFEFFENSKVMITGATGLIGSVIVKSLLTYANNNDISIKVIALVRNIDKANKTFKDFLSDNLIIYKHDINDKLDYKDEVDYIIHGASVTASRDFVDKPVETIFTAIEGTRNILDFAKNKNVKSLVYLSSLEVYGVPNHTNIIESENGTLDCTKVRSSYSEGKRLVECLCSSYSSEYGVPCKIARLSQTFGAGVQYNDSRVFAEFARCIIENRDIVLKTKGETYRNYCYLTDAISGILTVLAKGNNGEAYNISNKDTGISIADMARMLIDNYPESKVKLVFDLQDSEKLGFNPVVKICLDTSKLESLGWKATVSLKDAYNRMIQYMKGE